MKKKKKVGLSLNKFTVSSLSNLHQEKIIGGGRYSSPQGGCTGSSGGGGGGTGTCAVNCNPTATFTSCGTP